MRLAALAITRSIRLPSRSRCSTLNGRSSSVAIGMLLVSANENKQGTLPSSPKRTSGHLWAIGWWSRLGVGKAPGGSLPPGGGALLTAYPPPVSFVVDGVVHA